MTTADIQKIEERLGIRLTANYSSLMTSAEAQASAGEFWFHWLFNDADRVVKDTIWLRDLMASYGLIFKSSLVMISEINGGDAILIDTEGDPESLLEWDHETNEVAVFSTTFTKFVNS